MSFPRVDRTTVNVMRHCRAAGAKTIGIAGHLSSPVARLADDALLVQLPPLRLIPAFAAGASLINALVTAVSMRTTHSAAPTLEAAERAWNALGTWDGAP